MSRHGRFILAAVIWWCLLRQFSTFGAPPHFSVNDLEKITPPTPSQDDANLNDVCFMGSKIGWVVGDHGVLWHSRDGGLTWMLKKSTVDCPLRSVCFLTNQVGWIVGGRTAPFTRIGYGVVLSTTDGGATWQKFPENELPQLHFVKFFTMGDGIAVGETSSKHPTGVFVTNDGGKTWQDLDGPRNSSWRTGDFFSVKSGIVAGLRGRFSLISGRRLLDPQASQSELRGRQCVKLQLNQTGWLVGDGGLVLYTENGGVDWQPPPKSLPVDLRDITDFNTVVCRGRKAWIAGQPGSVIWHTNDAGSTWTKQYTQQPQPIHALHFRSETNGWAVGAFGMILKTDDGGQTWQTIRGDGRRVAMACFHARPSQVSLKLLSKYSGELGYRSMVSLPPRRDIGPDGHAARDLDLRLHEAVATAGGSIAEIGWRLPLAVPGLEHDAKKLKARWDRETDGRLSEVVLGTLVCQLRTWRPSVVVLDQPAADDAITTFLNDVVLHAVEQAADPTRFIQHYELARLKPWQVQKIYLCLPTGSTGHVHVDSFELLPRLGATVEMATASAYGKLMPSIARSSRRDAYRLLIDHTQGIRLTSAGDLFTGIAMAPDSPARRRLVAINDDKLDRQRRIARLQRNFRAYTEQFLDHPRHASQLIAKLNNIVVEMPDEQAAVQLAQLANEYRRRAQWELAESTLVELVDRFPDQPLAQDAMLWLFQLWTSTEVAWQRSRNTNVRGQRLAPDKQSVISQLQKTVGRTDDDQQQREKSSGSAGANSMDVVLRTNQLQFSVDQAWRQGAVRSWHQKALYMAKRVKVTSPALYHSPQVAFTLAALLRQRGSRNLADAVYRRHQRAGSGDPWARTALSEVWLSQPTNVPPKKFVICRSTDVRPVLDGILSDECWQMAKELTLKTTEDTVSGRDHAFALISFDTNSFYFCASIPRVAGLATDRPKLEGRTHDADLKGFDRIGFYLDIDRDYGTYYTLEIDQRGWVAESCWQDTGWNPKCYVAADADDTHWRFEAAIPFEELTAQLPDRKSVWAMGIIRTIPTVGVQSWTHPAGTRPRPESFGLVKFD